VSKEASYKGVGYALYFEGWEGECSKCRDVVVVGRTQKACERRMKEHIRLAHAVGGHDE
jgi:hypothetical protein